MSNRLGQITAYGDPDDRDRLEAIARYLGGSGSANVIRLIREKYRELFGDTSPVQIIGKGP